MALADLLAAPIVRPVTVGFLDFATDPVYGWNGVGSFAPTGTGDTDLDGNTFLPIGGAVHISDIVENRGIGEPLVITFAAGDMEDEEIFQQIVVDRREYRGRKAKFWRFFLTADESAVETFFEVLFDGVMVGAKTRRNPGQPSIIEITCDVDLLRASGPPVRWIDHKRFYSGDTASEFINDLGRGSSSQGRDGPGTPVPTPRPRQRPDTRREETF